MKVTPTALPGVLAIEPQEHADDRGWFFELWNDPRYAEHGVARPWAQDNISFSRGGVLRGMHWQHPVGQAKLVTVLAGAIWDVAVDVRRGSPTFGEWVGVALDAARHAQLFIPEGFAHGFVVTGESALVSYKVGARWVPGGEVGLLWNDPDVGIAWPVAAPFVAPRDAANPRLRDIAPDRLPDFGA